MTTKKCTEKLKKDFDNKIVLLILISFVQVFLKISMFILEEVNLFFLGLKFLKFVMFLSNEDNNRYLFF
jgi:hypothetical protein